MRERYKWGNLFSNDKVGAIAQFTNYMLPFSAATPWQAPGACVCVCVCVCVYFTPAMTCIREDVFNPPFIIGAINYTAFIWACVLQRYQLFFTEIADRECQHTAQCSEGEEAGETRERREFILCPWMSVSTCEYFITLLWLHTPPLYVCVCIYISFFFTAARVETGGTSFLTRSVCSHTVSETMYLIEINCFYSNFHTFSQLWLCI